MRTTHNPLDDVRRVGQDHWLKAAQWSAWIVALAVMVIAYRSGPLATFVAKRPMLSIEQVRLAVGYVNNIGTAAGRAGRSYGATEFGRDQRKIVNLRKIMSGCVAPNGTNFYEYESGVLNHLSQLAQKTEADRHYAEIHDRIQANRFGENAVMAAGQANLEYFRTAPVEPIAGLPVPPENPFPWRLFLHFYVLAWAWSLVPATACIALRFRGRFSELAAELRDRPWAPLLSAVFWWYGAYHYDGADLIERDFRSRCWKYREEYGQDPSGDMQRMLWERAAAPYVGGYAKAAEIAQRYPQVVAIQSRRLAFASLLAATVGTPITTFVNVVTAYAQSVRLTPAMANVDTTRPQRRTVSGRVFGIMTYNRESGFNLGTLWGTAQLKEGRVTGDAWVDFRKPEVMQASATYAATEQIGIEAGRIWSPTGNALPGPDTGMFPASTLGSYFPKGTADGIAVHAEVGPLTAIGSAQSGREPGRSDGNGYVRVQSGPLKVQAGAHVGTEEFRFAACEAGVRGLLVRVFGVARLDRDRKAVGTDIVYSRGPVRVGCHLEHDRWQVTAQRRLDAVSRVVVHVGRTDGVAGTAIMGKVQYGFALAP